MAGAPRWDMDNGTTLNLDPVKAKLEKAKQLGEEKLEVARDKAMDLMRRLELFVRERPAAAMGIGLGAGLLIGKLLKMAGKKKAAA